MALPVATDGWRQYDRHPLPRVLAAARDLFAAQGYHGTTIREIAAAVDLSVPGLYHHYPSKQDILVDLLAHVVADLLGRCRAAEESAGPGAPAALRFDLLVECLLRFHMARSREAFVASTEIRALEPAQRTAYIAQRDALQALLDVVVRDGIAEGAFSTAYPGDAARTVASLCVGVASWYRPDGPLPPDELLGRYQGFARAIVGG